MGSCFSTSETPYIKSLDVEYEPLPLYDKMHYNPPPSYYSGGSGSQWPPTICHKLKKGRIPTMEQRECCIM